MNTTLQIGNTSVIIESMLRCWRARDLFDQQLDKLLKKRILELMS